jgi:transcriptional regulator with XRE-family HTH domain
MQLGQAIKVVRTANGLRQREIARRLSVSPNYISLIEGGKREPSISFLNRLASVLGVPVGVFFLWHKSSNENRATHQLDRMRDLLVQLEAMHLLSTKPKQRAGRKAAVRTI